MPSDHSNMHPELPSHGIHAHELARILHDLRNGIGGVLGLTEMLRGTGLSEQQQELAQSIVAGTEAQLKFLEQLIDWSHAQADERSALTTSTFDIRDLLSGCARLHSANASEKGLRLVTDFHPLPSSVFQGDENVVRRIVCNLVSNAVKFTETGEVVLSCWWDENTKEIQIQVKDSGPGIPAELKEHIFNSFVHGGHVQSHGLGLAIVKDYAHSLGGSIQLAPSSEGATFLLSLPLRPTHATPSTTKYAHKSSLILSACHPTIQSISRQLAEHEVGVSSAPCTSGALAVLKAHERAGTPIDLLIVDSSLGGIDGQDAIECLRGALSEKTEIIPLRPLGAAEGHLQLTTPLQANSVAKLLSRLFSGELEAMSQQSKQSHSLPDPVNKKQKTHHILIVEDDAIQRSVLRRMLENEGHTTEAVGSVEDGLTRLALHEYDAVLTDWNLPDGDGLSFAREGIKRTQNLTPFYLITAHPTPTLQAQAKEVGIRAIVAKPISMDLIQQTMADVTKNALPNT